MKLLEDIGILVNYGHDSYTISVIRLPIKLSNSGSSASGLSGLLPSARQNPSFVTVTFPSM